MRKFTFAIIIFLSLISTGYTANWYVDNSVSSSGNGQAWTTAWKNFSDIVWDGAGVVAGDTLYISGGTTSRTYNEGLTVGASGSSGGGPITIKAGQDAGHNGVVIITNTSGGIYAIGLYITNRTYVTVDGNYNGSQHIRITGCTAQGVEVDNVVHHIVLTYLDITLNGDASNENGINTSLSTPSPSSTTPILEISHCKIHDNYDCGMVISGNDLGPNQYDRVLIHDNEIYDTRDDGIEANIQGISIYNNNIHDKKPTYVGHPDAIQGASGYLKIYNNTFYNFQTTESGTDADCSNSYIQPGFIGTGETSSGHVRVYNNLIYHTMDLLTYCGGPNDTMRGIELSITGAGLDTVTDVVIVNNTIVGMPLFGLFASPQRKDSGAPTTTATGWIIENNLIENCGRGAGGMGVFSLGRTGETQTYGSHGGSGNVTVDYNHISPGAGGGTGSQFLGTDYTYSNFRTASGTQTAITDTNSAALNSDHTIQTTSAAKWTGSATNQLSATDKAGTTWHSPPSIGAYEYVAPTTYLPWRTP